MANIGPGPRDDSLGENSSLKAKRVWIGIKVQGIKVTVSVTSANKYIYLKLKGILVKTFTIVGGTNVSETLQKICYKMKIE